MVDPLNDLAKLLKLPRAQIATLVDRYCVTDGKNFRLAKYDPADTADKLVSKDQANALLVAGIDRLSELQERLYADGRWAMLCVFQAMDAAGKDGTIRHVMSGVNPQGVEVTSFKAPSVEELRHGFLWRISRAAPARGHIGIFNRSHYEEVLVARVHPEILAAQNLPGAVVTPSIWKERLEAIADFERYLARQGTVILKFFLHVSKAEQRKRFLDRLDTPDKNWKFSANDLAERAYWDRYQSFYEEAIRATAAPHAPWYVVPADNKWFSRLVVSAAMIGTLDALDLSVPKLGRKERKSLDAARKTLERDR